MNPRAIFGLNVLMSLTSSIRHVTNTFKMQQIVLQRDSESGGG